VAVIDPTFFVRGFGFGLAVAAPVGPMSLLCMRRTLGQGWRLGLATGGGIALGDAVYAMVAALGLAGLSGLLLAAQRPMHLVAGAALLWLGLRTVLTPPATVAAEAGAAGSPAAALGSAVLLTLTNPPTIITFAAILASLAPPGGLGLVDGVVTVGGVFLGSLVWWCGLVAVVSAFRHAVGGPARVWIDRIAGAALALVGVLQIWRGL
jgi:threonine/homoserine/homoserine lactone efflux protein